MNAEPGYDPALAEDQEVYVPQPIERPVPTTATLVPSLVRTFVPLGVGYVLTLIAEHAGLVIDENSKQSLVGLCVIVLTAVYYSLVRVLEAKLPILGVLLGYPKQPDYTAIGKQAREAAAGLGDDVQQWVQDWGEDFTQEVMSDGELDPATMHALAGYTAGGVATEHDARPELPGRHRASE